MLHEQLLPQTDGDIEASPSHTSAPASALSPKWKIVLGVVGLLAVAAIVGAVAGTQARSSGSSSPQSGGSSFMVRPTFSTPIGSLKTAPPPTVYRVGNHTSSASLNFSHSMVNADGTIRHTYLSYDVVKNNNAHCLANHDVVMGVACAPRELRIHFANSSSAAAYAESWVNGTVLFLRYEWGCGQQVRMFVSKPYTEARVFVVSTINVTLAHAFHTASIRFHTNHSHDGEAKTLKPFEQRATTGSGAHTHRRSLWSALESIAGSVLNAVEDVVQYVATGQVDVDPSFTASYTIPSSTMNFNSGDGNVVGSLTYSGSMSFTTGFDLSISSYVFQSFSASVAASASMSLAPSIQGSEAYATSDQQQLTQTTVSMGVVPVFGISIPLNLIVTTYGGYSISLSANANIAGTVTGAGSASYGLSVVSGSGPQTTSSASFSLKSQLSTAQYAATAQFVPYLSVSAYLQAAYVGGPVGVATVYADVNGDISSSNGNCLDIAEDAGLEVDVAAKYSLDFAGHNFGSGSTPWATLYGPATFWKGSQQYCPNSS